MATAEIAEIELEPPLIEPAEHYEVVNGQIIGEPPLGTYECWLASFLDRKLGNHAESHRLGWVVSEALFLIRCSPTLRRRPDLAFISFGRWPEDRPLSREAAWDVIPDLAIEITSPTDLIDDLMDKIEEYFEAGTRMVWVIYPKHRKIYVYESPVLVRILRIGDDLDGGEVIPGFILAVSSMFGPGPAGTRASLPES